MLIRQRTMPVECYDLAGNMREDSLNRYLYDAFSMMKDRSPGLGSEYYIFNAADERLGTLTTAGKWTWTLRDEGGKVLREYQSVDGNSSATATWLTSYVYRDGLLAGAERVQEEGGRRYFHLDHLGTPRLITGAGGVQLAAHDYYRLVASEPTCIKRSSLVCAKTP